MKNLFGENRFVFGTGDEMNLGKRYKKPEVTVQSEVKEDYAEAQERREEAEKEYRLWLREELGNDMYKDLATAAGYDEIAMDIGEDNPEVIHMMNQAIEKKTLKSKMKFLGDKIREMRRILKRFQDKSLLFSSELKFVQEIYKKEFSGNNNEYLKGSVTRLQEIYDHESEGGKINRFRAIRLKNNMRRGLKSKIEDLQGALRVANVYRESKWNSKKMELFWKGFIAFRTILMEIHAHQEHHNSIQPYLI